MDVDLKRKNRWKEEKGTFGHVKLDQVPTQAPPVDPSVRAERSFESI